MELVRGRQNVSLVMGEFQYSEREACKLMDMDRTSYHYQPRPAHNAELCRELIARPRQTTLRLPGLAACWSGAPHKASPQRVYRICCQEHRAAETEAAPRLAPEGGQLHRECPVIEMDTGLSSAER